MIPISIQIVELLIQQESVMAELHTQTADELRSLRKTVADLADDLDNRIVIYSTRAENAAASRDYMTKILEKIKADPTLPVLTGNS